MSTFLEGVGLVVVGLWIGVMVAAVVSAARTWCRRARAMQRFVVDPAALRVTPHLDLDEEWAAFDEGRTT